MRHAVKKQYLYNLNYNDMKKLLFIGALLCVLCSCGSGNGGAKKYDDDVVKENRTEYKKYDDDVVKEDRAEYKKYVGLALEQEMYGDKDRAVKYYEAALELEKAYNGTEYAHWFNNNASGKFQELLKSLTTGTHKGYEWVDLGLSVKWATCNVGASTPGAKGNYYAWGETSTKREYTESNSASYGKSWGDIGGNSSRDAARANWGGNWRMPTEAEFQELKDNCTWEWKIQGRHIGCEVRGPNGNSIFLPLAGYRSGDTLYKVGEQGNYWSSSSDDCSTNSAFSLLFCVGVELEVGWIWASDSRCYFGRSVRPVLED